MQYSEQFLSVEKYIRGLQNKICAAVEELEAVSFRQDRWQRPAGGGGLTRVMENGDIFEKGGVNFSAVHGTVTEAMAAELKLAAGEFAACGISLILHPRSPKIPAIHLNLRYFELSTGKSWFGGGIDLTPFYPFPEDFSYFHRTLKTACNGVLPDSYPKFKEDCDRYFTIRHRQEMRGVGGIFFDRLPGEDPRHFALLQTVGEAFLPAYIPLVHLRKVLDYTEADRLFQQVRRGRYIEFNLLYDRGTRFGLNSGGRPESIFISMPPEAKFIYNWEPPAGTPQQEMLQYYQPRDWLE